MIIAKQMDIRSNIKDYFDRAFQGETIVVPRKQNRNVVIISEAEYHELSDLRRISTYQRALSDIASSHSPGKTSLRNANLQKLDRIEALSDGWNGNGAPAIPAPVLTKTRSLLMSIPIQPEIFPTALSSIQLEFDNSRHDHMEIDINESDYVDIFIVSYMGQETEETIPADESSIIERVTQFYG